MGLTYRGPGLAAGADVYLAAAGAVGNALAALAPGSLSVDEVALGLTGLNGRSPDAQALGAAVQERVPLSTLVAADDSVTAFLGAVGLRSGVVIAAGTGVTVFALGGDGGVVHGDGYGPYVGDWGGGHWIGRAGLSAALRSVDGHADGSARLAELAFERFGDLGGLPHLLWVDADRVSTVASFTAEVVESASDGDPVSQAILVEAGRLLARSAATAAARVVRDTSFVCSWTGGVFEGAAVVLESFCDELAQLVTETAIEPPAGGCLDGVARLFDPDVQDALSGEIAVWAGGR